MVRGEGCHRSGVDLQKKNTEQKTIGAHARFKFIASEKSALTIAGSIPQLTRGIARTFPYKVEKRASHRPPKSQAFIFKKMSVVRGDP